MGATSGKLSSEQGRDVESKMRVQRQYVNVRLDAIDFSDPTGAADADADARDEKEDEGEAQEEDGASEDVTYKAYTPSKMRIPGMRPHPSNAVENGTLATVSPPDPTYALAIARLRPEVVLEGRLSDLQLEFVTYASQRHECNLPSGSRCGFFLGDGAGMGKGRQLAGLVLENTLLGRKRHIWVSTNIDLREDAKRDLRDVGCCADVFQMPSSSKSRIEETSGVMFLTYSGMSKGCSSKSVEKGDLKRLDQIVEWCGVDFEGCLLFDEAHRAKNLVSEQGNSNSTAAGLAVFRIQQLLPRARVVYCSATAVSEPRNYGYMTRLGLWGPNSPFPCTESGLDETENSHVAIKNFVKIVAQRGVGAMELCALHLKQEGALLCRTLSFEGAEFDILEATLSEEQQEQYDTAAQLWQYLHTRCEEKLATMAQDSTVCDAEYKRARQSAHSQFWGGHQRFFKSLITGYKVPELVRVAKEALLDEKCVVIGLQSTGEAFSKRARDLASRREKTCLKKKGEEEEEEEEALFSSQNTNEDMLSAPQETLKYVVRKIWAQEVASLDEKRNQVDSDEKCSTADSEDDDLELLGICSTKKPFVDEHRGALASPSTSRRKKPKLEEATLAPVEDCWGWDEDVTDLTGGCTGDLFSEDGMDVEDSDDWIASFLAKVDALHLPGNALDVILEELGNFDAVAEMSGRSYRTVRTWTGEYEYVARSENGVTSDEQNLYEREEFQQGRKLVAIISDAASSGISLHCENHPRVANQRRRVHITLELPWSADKTIQQMGRSHRSNQICAPEYILLVSPLGGERRFVSSVVKRLESLGALTQGDRRATGISKGWACFNVDTKEGQHAVLDIFHHTYWESQVLLAQQKANPNRPLVAPPKLAAREAQHIAKLVGDNKEVLGVRHGSLFESTDHTKVKSHLNLLHASRLWLSLVGICVEEFDSASPSQVVAVVAKFLNRILGLEISRQQCLFDYFARYLEKTIEAATRDGTYQLGIRNISGRSVTFMGDNKRNIAVKTPSHLPIRPCFLLADPGIDFAAVLTVFAKSRGDARGSDARSTTSGTTTTGTATGTTGTTARDDDDDDDEKRCSSGWIDTHRRTAFQAPGEQRFGDRDGFRTALDGYDVLGESASRVILIVETGEASVRGLSVKTDKFRVFRADDYPTVQTWGWIRKLYPDQVHSEEKAKRAWDRKFEQRKKENCFLLLTGPILYIWAKMLQAQAKCVYLKEKEKIRIYRAVEHDDKEKCSGKEALGILVEWKHREEIIDRLEALKNSDQATFEDLQFEDRLHSDHATQQRAARSKANWDKA